LILKELVEAASSLVESGYYDVNYQVQRDHRSLKRALFEDARNNIICEVKLASPSQGDIQTGKDPVGLAVELERAGATALSVLTQPHGFKGSIDSLAKIAAKVKIPVMMKDIVVSPRQVKAAARSGADAILVIYSVSKYVGMDRVKDILTLAGEFGLETVLETHGRDEIGDVRALQFDILGVNNRNLEDMTIDLDVSRQVLMNPPNDPRPILFESGISTPDELRELRGLGARAFLIGTSIMKASNPTARFKELLSA
jgi:indole-3-glycerol phosphate synthase